MRITHCKSEEYFECLTAYDDGSTPGPFIRRDPFGEETLSYWHHEPLGGKIKIIGSKYQLTASTY